MVRARCHAPGAELQINAVYDTAQLGFDVRAQHNLHGCSTITNPANLSNGAGGARCRRRSRRQHFWPVRILAIDQPLTAPFRPLAVVHGKTNPCARMISSLPNSWPLASNTGSRRAACVSTMPT